MEFMRIAFWVGPCGGTSFAPGEYILLAGRDGNSLQIALENVGMTQVRFGKVTGKVGARWLLAVVLALGVPSIAQTSPIAIHIDWKHTVIVSRSSPTLQVVTNPMLKRGSPLHDSAFKALADLGANYVRFVPWLPYPRTAVAELKPPTAEKTFWDFSQIDPVVEDFMKATDGHSTVVNFSTIPAWMFKTEKPVSYPDDPDQVFWGYTQGTELTDATGKQLGDYYGRLVSWYVKGGFIDENHKWHASGHHYDIQYWEILNEIDSEHSTTPEDYTKRYDAIVNSIRKVSPHTKFV
jgi:hypothetical protein